MDIHAFNRKRTLAPQFFNAQQITRANNKQFASGIRGGNQKVQNPQRSRSPKKDMNVFNSTYQTADTGPMGEQALLHKNVWAQHS